MTDFNPVGSGFIGSYKGIYFKNRRFGYPDPFVATPVLCESFGENSKMAATTIKTFDGKPISTIKTLGEVSQGFNLNGVPVTVGRTPEFYDAREFFFRELENLFQPQAPYSYELPLMTQASLSISDSSSMNFTLESDGIRNVGLLSENYLFFKDSNGNIVDFCGNSVRTAYQLDFILAFGPYMAFIKGATFGVNIEVNSINPIRQTVVDTAGSNAYDLNQLDSNRQYKILIPRKATITASGEALVDLEDCNFSNYTNYDLTGYKYLTIQDAPAVVKMIKESIFAPTGDSPPIIGNQFELFFNQGTRYDPFFREAGKVGIEILSGYFTSIDLKIATSAATVSFGIELNAQVVQL